MNFDVVGVGALVADIFVEAGYITISFEEKSLLALPAGKTSSRIYLRAGGSSGNTVSYLSKLGLSTGYFTKLGTDALSDFLIQEFEKFGVNTEGIIRDPSLTAGISVILFASGVKDRALAVNHGAGDELSKEDIEEKASYLTSASWLDVSSFTSQKAVNALFELFKLAKSKGVRIFFAPSKTMISKFPAETFELVKQADAVAMNKTEAEMLLKMPWREALNYFAGKKEFAFITLGANGMSCAFRGKLYYANAYPIERVKNTTGAGDAAAALFLFGLIKNWSAEKILTYASIASSLHVAEGSIGAREGLPSLEEIEEKAKEGLVVVREL